MPLFASRLDRALAACAGALPARLAQDYGASETYTAGQITRALATLNAAPAAAPYAYAMYLPEDEYEKLDPRLQAASGYTAARLVFAAHRPARPTAAADFRESGIGLSGAGLTYGGN